MTSNQIAYWNLQEQKRANLINEGIKGDDIRSQIQRREHQNTTDAIQAATGMVNAITGGAKNLAPLLFL